MKKQQFDTVIDRSNSNSMKWRVGEKELPMWVADMDFKCCEPILEALYKCLEHGIFGYSDMSEDWAKSICNWWEKRHLWQLDEDWLLFCSGVIPAVSSVVRKCTSPGDRILTMTPVYHIFFHSIENNGRFVSEHQLRYHNHTYEIDFALLEQQLSDPRTTMLIFCNPHNPIGKLWSREEIERVAELCEQYHVTVISDEIHCDLVDPGCAYIPFASVSATSARISITCVAPTKSFNIAGLQSAAVIVPNEALRSRVKQALNDDEVAEPNVFALPAAIAAFTRGASWLDELRHYIKQNKQLVEAALADEEDIQVVIQQATYLMWLDCHELCTDSVELAAFIRKHTGLILSDGSQFRGNGKHFLRMNVACPKATLQDGIYRLKRGLALYREQMKKETNA